MSVNYALTTLKAQQNKLQDRLFEIAEGNYDKHPVEQVNRLKTDLTDKLKDIELAIQTLTDRAIK